MSSNIATKQPTPSEDFTLKPNVLHHPANPLHPAWRSFIEYCMELGHGEIEILKIQDGLPVLAEVTRKKIKFPLLK